MSLGLLTGLHRDAPVGTGMTFVLVLFVCVALYTAISHDPLGGLLAKLCISTDHETFSSNVLVLKYYMSVVE